MEDDKKPKRSRYYSSYLDLDDYYAGYNNLPWVDYSKPSRTTPEYYKDSYTSGSRYYVNRNRGNMSSFITTSYGRSSIEGGKDVQVRRTELFDKSLKLTKEFISILNLPYQISIHLASGISEIETIVGSTSRRIFLPTEIFDKISEKKDEDIINTVVGQGLHESAHLKYTELSVFEDELSKIPTDNRYSILMNILEDERVDRLLIRERPGYKNFILQAKKYKLEGFSTKRESLKKEGKLLFDLMCYIRYPEVLTEKVLEERESFFSKIQEILNSSSLEKTVDIIPIINKIISVIDSETSSVKNYKELVKLYVPLLYGSDKDGGLSLPSDFITRGISGRDIASHSFIVDMKLSMGIYERGDDKSTFFCTDIVEDAKLYQKLKTGIQKFVPQIRKKLIAVDKNSAFNIYGCRSGLLDTTKLVEAYQDVPQVYIRSGSITTNKVSVCILVDESGSMGCCNRAERARDAAILLYEAMSGISGVNLYVYGHTADQIDNGNEGYSTDIRVYVEPGKDRHKSMVNIQGRWENRDGTAILECAKRIRKKTQEKCIMFVISDGCPAAYNYWGTSAIKDTANKIKEAERLNFEIVQITIQGDIGDTKQMFSKYIDLRDSLDELPEKMGKIVRDFIIENKTSTITT